MLHAGAPGPSDVFFFLPRQAPRRVRSPNNRLGMFRLVSHLLVSEASIFFVQSYRVTESQSPINPGPSVSWLAGTLSFVGRFCVFVHARDFLMDTPIAPLRLPTPCWLSPPAWPILLLPCSPCSGLQSLSARVCKKVIATSESLSNFPNYLPLFICSSLLRMCRKPWKQRQWSILHRSTISTSLPLS
jgi:hypothetical protein